MTTPRSRGFTLVETVVALAMGAVLLSAVVALTVNIIRTGRRARTISAMQRDMTSLGLMLATELRQAGVGVPFDKDFANAPDGEHIIAGYGATDPSGSSVTRFRSRVLIARPRILGFVGDLPRDDANFPAFGLLHGRPLSNGCCAPTNDRVWWHTENNGSCAQDDQLGSCLIGNTSLFFPFAGLSACTSTTDRRCPWGLRRVLHGEPVVIADGLGRWGTAKVDLNSGLASAYIAPPRLPWPTDGSIPWSWGSTTCSVSPGGSCFDDNAVSANVAAAGQMLAVRLDPSWGAQWPSYEATVGTSTVEVNVRGPGEVPGGGFLSTPDRVFYRLNPLVGGCSAPSYCTIERKRCFGDPDPNNANFPVISAVSVPSGFDYSNASPQLSSKCGHWETVARNVSSLDFKYYNFADNETTSVSEVRRIGYFIIFKKNVDGRDVVFASSGSVRL